MPAPDLSRFPVEIREAIIRRRAAKLAEGGRPAEYWNESRTRVIDRDAIIREAVEKAVKAQLGETAPAAGAVSAPPAEIPPAEPAPVESDRPLHELSLDGLRSATREGLNAMFNHLDGERRPSPFWLGLERPDGTTA